MGWGQSRLAAEADAGDKSFISRVERGAVDRVVNTLRDALSVRVATGLPAIEMQAARALAELEALPR